MKTASWPRADLIIHSAADDTKINTFPALPKYMFKCTCNNEIYFPRHCSTASGLYMCALIVLSSFDCRWRWLFRTTCVVRLQCTGLAVSIMEAIFSQTHVQYFLTH